jgi:DNA-binding response OmpR family regulator
VAKVLVVDDDLALLRTIGLTLRLEGFEVLTASSGEQGLLEVGEHAPDVIILDLQMPIMDGRAFFRRLRHEGHRTPVLILSANGAREARRELAAEGAMNKPFDPDELVRTVQQLIPA